MQKTSVYKDISKFPEITKQIIKNRKEETQTFDDFNNVFQDPKKLITMTGFVLKKFNIDEISTSRMMSKFFIFHGLNRLETCACVLREFVNPSKKIGKKRIKVTQNTPLRQLVLGVSQELGMAEFEVLFPLQLHAIAQSGTWYFKNDGISFIDEDGNGNSITQKDFTELIGKFDSNFSEIIEEWKRRNAKQENLI